MPIRHRTSPTVLEQSTLTDADPDVLHLGLAIRSLEHLYHICWLPVRVPANGTCYPMLSAVPTGTWVVVSPCLRFESNCVVKVACVHPHSMYNDSAAQRRTKRVTQLHGSHMRLTTQRECSVGHVGALHLSFLVR